jgi:hypothetical protein
MTEGLTHILHAGKHGDNQGDRNVHFDNGKQVKNDAHGEPREGEDCEDGVALL